MTPMTALSLIPYVCGAGASTPGCEHGPLYCHEHDLTGRLAASGIDAAWIADPHLHWDGPQGRCAQDTIPPRGSPERSDIVSWHCREVAANVATALRAGQRAVTIGGDHSLAAGSIAGVQQAFGRDIAIGVIWVDAHPDLHMLSSSQSKALHGMPMGTLLGLDETLAVPGACKPVLRPENVVYVGLRDIDEGEYENAKSLGLTLLTMDRLRQQGIAGTIEREAARLSARCDKIVLSVDLDGFSPEVAPAVGTPVEDGFMPEEILPALAEIVRAMDVPLIDIVEFNPTLPGAEKTYQFLVTVLTALTGR